MFRKFPHGMSCWAAIPCGIEWGAIDLERVRRLKVVGAGLVILMKT